VKARVEKRMGKMFEREKLRKSESTSRGGKRRDPNSKGDKVIQGTKVRCARKIGKSSIRHL